jgi:hypothetical protein
VPAIKTAAALTLCFALCFFSLELRQRLTGRAARGNWLERAPKGHFELELELIQTQMAQKPMLRAEVGMRVHCANKASAE